MKNPRLALMGTLAIGALSLSACGGQAPESAPSADFASVPNYSGTISILTKFAGEPLESYFEDIAKRYEKEHPEVSVELIQETDQSIKDKVRTLTASNALTDAYFTWTGNWQENFVRGGLAADLSEVIGPDTQWGSDFGEASLEAFAIDGKYYGIPMYNNGKFMGYNKEAFEKAGVDIPTTFEGLIGSCTALRNAGYQPIAFGNKDGWPALHYLQQLFAYNVPADVLHADFKPETAAWTDPGYELALTQYQQLVDECTDTQAGSNGVLYTTAQESFAGSRSAMYYQEILEFDSVAGKGKLDPEQFGIFPLPAPEGAAGDPGAIEGAPEGYMINAKSPQAVLAADFMKFATSQANAKTLSAVPYGQPSAVKGAVTEQTSSAAVATGIEKVNGASSLVMWLDTVTVPEVADAWLAGGEALTSGSSTPGEVIESVRSASESAK